jgi:hypothetical protein
LTPALLLAYDNLFEPQLIFLSISMPWSCSGKIVARVGLQGKRTEDIQFCMFV